MNSALVLNFDVRRDGNTCDFAKDCLDTLNAGLKRVFIPLGAYVSNVRVLYAAKRGQAALVEVRSIIGKYAHTDTVDFGILFDAKIKNALADFLFTRFRAHSGVIRPPIPIASGHPYRFSPATQTGASGHP